MECKLDTLAELIKKLAKETDAKGSEILIVSALRDYGLLTHEQELKLEDALSFPDRAN